MSSEIYWINQPPQWDPTSQQYYWEGYKLQGSTIQTVWQFLKSPNDFDSNGNPHQGLHPPESAVAEQASTPRTIQRPGEASSASGATQPLSTYPSSAPDQQSEILGSGPNYTFHSGSPGRGKSKQNQVRADELEKLSDEAFLALYAGGNTDSSLNVGPSEYGQNDGQVGTFQPTQRSASGAAYQKIYTADPGPSNSSVPPPSTKGKGVTYQHSSRGIQERYKRSSQRDHHEDRGSASTSRSEKSSSHRHPPDRQRGNFQQGGAFPGLGSSTFGTPGIPSSHDISVTPSPLSGVKLNKKAVDQAPRIRSNGYGEDYLDPNFAVFPSSEFKPGKIVKMMWSEPKSTTVRGSLGSRITDVRTLVEEHRKAFWRGFRRFIIVHNNEGHCTCVPIYTYRQQGCKKPGVKPKQHGIIHEDGNRPDLLPGEPPLGFQPIRAVTTLGEPMADASRVNYAKVVTVEHNIMVMFVGEVVGGDWPIAKAAARSFFD